MGHGKWPSLRRLWIEIGTRLRIKRVMLSEHMHIVSWIKIQKISHDQETMLQLSIKIGYNVQGICIAR